MSQSPLERRVAGLLAQADAAGTEHEANVFRAKATQLIAEYGLDEAKVRASKADQGKVVVRQIEISGERKKEQVRLWHGLARALHCESVHRTDYTQGTVIGVEGHVQRLILLFELLRPQLLKETKRAEPRYIPDWLTASERAGRIRKFRNSFATGWVHGVSSLLGEAEETASTSEEARTSGADLVLLKDAEKARKELEVRYPKLKKVRWKSPGEGFGEGFDSGVKADLKGNQLATKTAVTA